MFKVLLASAAVATALVLSTPVKAVIIDLGVNPTSAQGDFSTAPGGGAFADFITFQLVGGPQFVTIASATNTFAQASDFIAQWSASIYQQVGVPGVGGDDILVFGPQAASPCVLVPNCQQVGGSALLNPANYYVEFSGIAGGTSGYGGNVSTLAVPGPVLGGGLPGVLAAAAFIGWYRRRKMA